MTRVKTHRPAAASLLATLLLMTILSAVTTAQAGDIKPKQEICKEAKAAVPHMTPADLQSEIIAGKELVVLDIRTKAEYDAGHIDGAIWLPRGFLEIKVEGLVPDPEATIVVYCLKGCRGSLAVQALLGMGYENVYDLAGGIAVWIKEELPLYNQYG
jgi:rhodanese-related sulfurtransferase